VGESKPLLLPGFFSFSHFCTVTQWPFYPGQHWGTFFREIWEDTVPSFSREIIKHLCPQEVPCPFHFPTFPWMIYAPPTECQFGGFYNTTSLPSLTHPLLHLYPSGLPQGMYLHCCDGTCHLGFSPWPPPECMGDRIFQNTPFLHSLLQKM
jgi:hypothetical protein